jgi:hypothetical protein
MGRKNDDEAVLDRIEEQQWLAQEAEDRRWFFQMLREEREREERVALDRTAGRDATLRVTFEPDA